MADIKTTTRFEVYKQTFWWGMPIPLVLWIICWEMWGSVGSGIGAIIFFGMLIGSFRRQDQFEKEQREWLRENGKKIEAGTAEAMIPALSFRKGYLWPWGVQAKRFGYQVSDMLMQAWRWRYGVFVNVQDENTNKWYMSEVKPFAYTEFRVPRSQEAVDEYLKNHRIDIYVSPENESIYWVDMSWFDIGKVEYKSGEKFWGKVVKVLIWGLIILAILSVVRDINMNLYNY